MFSTPRYFSGVTFAAGVIALSLYASHAQAGLEDEDLGLFVSEGRIHTGDVEADESIDPTRVFFREGEPFSGDWFVDLGIDSEAGSFDPDSAIGFNFRGPLALWLNESDGFRYLDSATEETASLERGGLAATTGDGFVGGFTWDVRSSGAFHEHYDLWIDNPGHGNDAIYLLELEFWSTDDSLAATYRSEFGEHGASDPFWVIVAREHSDEVAKAMGYVTTTVIPEPAAGGMLAAVAGVMWLRRRPTRRRGMVSQF